MAQELPVILPLAPSHPYTLYLPRRAIVQAAETPKTENQRSYIEHGTVKSREVYIRR